MRKGSVNVNFTEAFQSAVEWFFPVHVRGVHPYQCFFRQYFRNAYAWAVVSHNIGKDVRTVSFFLGKLCVAIEYVYLLDLVAEE